MTVEIIFLGWTFRDFISLVRGGFRALSTMIPINACPHDIGVILRVALGALRARTGGRLWIQHMLLCVQIPPLTGNAGRLRSRSCSRITVSSAVGWRSTGLWTEKPRRLDGQNLLSHAPCGNPLMPLDHPGKSVNYRQISAVF